MNATKPDISTYGNRLGADTDSLRREAYGLRQTLSAMCSLVQTEVDLTSPDTRVLEVLDEALLALMQAVDAKDGSLFILDDETGELIFILSHGEVPPDMLRWRRVPRGQGIVAWVARHGTAAVVNDTEFDERFCSWFDEELSFETQSVLAVPLTHDGRVLGVMEALNKREDKRFSTDDLQVMNVMCHLAGKVLSPLIDELKAASPGH